MRFEDFVGLRYLMAKRDRNMLSVITLISVGGVAVGVMALIVVLSVMGGFESDFRDKIIGSKAHVVISAKEGYLSNYEDIMRTARDTKGVVAANAYVEAEVMLNSPTNLQTAIIRGVDYRELTGTTRMNEYMKEGKLEYIENPDILPTIETAGSVIRSGTLTLHSDEADPELTPERIEALERAGARASIAFAGSKHGAWLAGAPTPSSPEETLKVIEDLEEEIAKLEKSIDDKAASIKDIESSLNSDAPPQHLANAANVDAASAKHEMDEEERLLLEEIGVDNWISDGADVRKPAMLEFASSNDAPSFDREPTAELLHESAPKRIMRDMPGLNASDIGMRSVGGIVLGQELKMNLGLFLGTEVNVMSPTGDLAPTGGLPKSRPFKLVGSYYSGMFDFDAKMGYISKQDAQALLGIGNMITGIDIRCENLEDSIVVRDRLREALADYPNVRVDDWMSLNASLFGAIMLEKIAMFVILTSIILVASFSILCLLIMMVIEKAREIAIFKAMGATGASVVRIFVIQGAVIGALGTLIGLALGLGMCSIIASLGISLPGGVYYITQIPVSVNALEVAVICLAAFGISLLATVIPSAMAVKLKPVDGLRYD